MAKKVGKACKNDKGSVSDRKRRSLAIADSIPTLAELSCSVELERGVENVAGAARLSIAAVEDMLSGRLTPQEATVVNTSTGRILKACELHLKFARSGGPQLCLPKPD